MINGLVLALGFVLLCVQCLIDMLLDHVAISQWGHPSLVLPLVLYMAVGEFSLRQGAVLSFVLGWLTDSFAGLPPGWNMFSLTAIFLLARVAGLKLFLHGVVFQFLLTYVASFVVVLMLLGLFLVFEQTPLAIGPALALSATQSLSTALLSPLVFALVRALPGAERPRPEDA